VTSRLSVRKTYKLYLGGAFARSESGRHSELLDSAGAHWANVPRGSRKDVRDAVRAARGAFPGWAGRTAYNRGQILYRLAEALEARSAELAGRTAALRGVDAGEARAELAGAVDCLVHYAGWTDKLHAVLGEVSPVAGPYFTFAAPEPTGVVAVLAPDEPDGLGLVAEIAPPLCAGNVVVALVSERWPAVGLDLGEVLGVSDVPPGVVNLLSGRREELVPHLAGHRDVNAIADAQGDPALSTRVAELASETIKRVSASSSLPYLDPARRDALGRVEPWVELKTAWHPVGL
jgi:acyl-CoA reductase-like NAD-dependent aldehyde dehydrogenase